MTTENNRRKVLILEDEMIVGMDLAMSLEDAGFVIQGPFNSPEKALTSLEKEYPDFAVLDLNLGNGKTSRDVADHLTKKGCPFAFLTGYGASSHPVVREFDHAECLSKPIDMNAVSALIRASIA